jgi:formamidopyrimidine-DNA glycosylase
VNVTFGLTGGFTLNPMSLYIKIAIVAHNNSNPIFYDDMRNFGNWSFWPKATSQQDLADYMSTKGVDLLSSDNLLKTEVVGLFRGTGNSNKQEITQALMSQKIFAGPGNYLKSESLYASKISPYAIVKDLTDDNIYDLYKNLIRIAKAAYKEQSKWLEQRTDQSPDKTYDEYQEYMEIYKKDKDKNGHTVHHVNDTKDKRTTHYVKEVQTIGVK